MLMPACSPTYPCCRSCPLRLLPIAFTTDSCKGRIQWRGIGCSKGEHERAGGAGANWKPGAPRLCWHPQLMPHHPSSQLHERCSNRPTSTQQTRRGSGNPAPQLMPKPTSTFAHRHLNSDPFETFLLSHLAWITTAQVTTFRTAY